MAVLGHDLRTPLVAQLGALDVLRRNIPSGEPRHIVECMQHDGHGMLQLIDDILELSQLGEGELRLRLEPFSPNVLLGEVADLVRPLADEKETRVELKTNKSILLLGDISALRRILVNFATNAVKATRSGTITLALEEGKSGPDGREITFAITDTGCGISANEIPKLFRDFGTLEPQDPTQSGTGLGLAICRRLATAMGGEVGVESTKSRGSRFWLKITLAEAPDKLNTVNSEGHELTQVLSELRVLVAEDHQMTRHLTSTTLARYGALTTEAVDGLEAVERAETERFDLILMDIQMPRLDGAEAAARIRDSGGPSSTARIIGITAHQSPEMASILSNLSLDACLSKPLDLQALAALLRDEALPQSNKDTTEDFNTDKLADLRQIDGGELLSKSLRALNEEIRMVRIDLPLLINSDIIAAGRLAHKLAGFCDFLGAQTLANELRRFETQSKNAAKEGLFRTLSEMDTLMAATQKKVDRILNEIETDLMA